MSKVHDILAEKGRTVYTIDPDASVLSAARLMNVHKIGALVVVEEDGRVAGMFTERDVLSRVVSQCMDPAATPVGDVMTTQVLCCEEDTAVDDVRAVMRNHRVRHLPVVDGQQRLRGLISIGDLNAWQLNGQEATISCLREYLYGVS